MPHISTGLHSANTYHKYWQAGTPRQLTHDKIHLNNTKMYMAYNHSFMCPHMQNTQKDRLNVRCSHSLITQKSDLLVDLHVFLNKPHSFENTLGYGNKFTYNCCSSWGRVVSALTTTLSKAMGRRRKKGQYYVTSSNITLFNNCWRRSDWLWSAERVTSLQFI